MPFNMLWDADLVARNLEYRFSARWVYPHTARIRSLTVLPKCPSSESRPAVLYELVTGLSRMLIPNLVTLSVLHGDGQPSAAGFGTDMSILGQCIGDNQITPDLRELSLTRIILSVETSRGLFSTILRHLSLLNCHFWCNVDEMVETLQVTPMLEIFRYYLEGSFQHNAKFGPSRSARYPLRHVRLPHLQELSFSSTFAINIYMFIYLAFPSTATLCLTEGAPSSAVSAAEVAPFVEMGRQSLSEHFAHATTYGASYQALGIFGHLVSAPTYVNELVPQLGLNILLEAAPLPRQLEMKMPVIEEESVVAVLLDMTLGLPVFHDIEQLTLLSNGSYTLSFFERFPRLKTLALCVADPIMDVPFFDILQGVINNRDEFLPKLTCIMLKFSGTLDTGENFSLEIFEWLADAILAHWGEGFEVFGISFGKYDLGDVEDVTAIVRVLVDKLGLDRVRCWTWDSEDGKVSEVGIISAETDDQVSDADE